MARRFLKRITLKKAIKTGAAVLAAFAAGVAATELPTDPEAIQTGGAGLAIAVIMASIRAYNNMKKNDHLEGNPLKKTGYPSGYMWALALALALASVAAVSGCVVLEHADGTREYRLDSAALQTAWDAYERLVERRAELDAARVQADAEERARIEAEITRLEPEIREAWRRLSG